MDPAEIRNARRGDQQLCQPHFGYRGIIRFRLLLIRTFSNFGRDICFLCRFVIMPDHIHAIIFLYPDKYITRKDGSSRAPTNEMLPHIVSTFKRFCNKEIGNNIFQRGYIDHVIRDREDYETRSKYIYENPIRWYYDEFYTKK